MTRPMGPTRPASRRRRVPARDLIAAALLAATLLTPRGGIAAEDPAAARATTGSIGSIGLPHYVPPDAYRVDLVIRSPEGNMVMKRSIDHGRIRTEMNMAGTAVVMIELGDTRGTSLTLMPEEKRAIRQSREGMSAVVGDEVEAQIGESHHAAELAPPDARIEPLGEETLGGRVVKKLRMSMPEGSSLGWFDKVTGAPVRMEATVDGKTSAIEWKDWKVGPQPAKLFEAPKDYELMDMDEMMSNMKEMGGSSALKELIGGMGGPGGMPGLPGGGLNGMMGGMGQNLGGRLGGSLGGSLGGALGGPLGAMAGQYLGGKVGGMIGRKAATAVTPGK